MHGQVAGVRLENPGAYDNQLSYRIYGCNSSQMQDFYVLNRVSRRKLLVSGLFFVASSSVAAAADGEGLFSVLRGLSRRRKVKTPDADGTVDSNDPATAEEEYFDPALLPPPESEIDYAVEPVDPSLIKSLYRRQAVEFDGYEEPGTIVVDPKAHFLYHVLGDGQAMRYGVGVGRAGFAWSGDAEIRMKRRWPRWVPPREMVDRDQRAKRWVNGQPGGPENPLGARALYLFSDGKDTLYRIHGTNEPSTIGKSVSSGCVRMLNEDVATLFDEVEVGTQVVVRSA
jgi:lipoprotein-anchoring transpeptidase ErfK/SrfK